ncbi:MAG: PAS domain S-box protein, partial [Desulfobacterales bacterium]|nr:PAS domain S-box protein [Desulfobacterales bacterium]
MPLRLIIFSLALIGFLSASTGGGLYYYAYREAAFEKNETQARSQLSLVAGQLSGYLSEHAKSVRTLAEIQELRQALETTNLDTIYRANQVLDTFTQTLEARACYLIDGQGITLCSSNRNRADSFVGMDYGFRPYFKRAFVGNIATYLALGVNSMKRGIYYSHPVYNQDRSRVLGVAVIKSSVEFVEDFLFPDSDTPLFFTSPEGLIFISNTPELRFRLLWQLRENQLDALVESRQFGNGPWEWAGFTPTPQGQVMDQEGNLYLRQALAVQGHPGWILISLRNAQAIEKQVTRPILQIIGAVVGGISVLAGILVFILYRSAVREIGRRQEAEEQLRDSEERYRAIYHNTPVMLHSIDTEGNIIHISDHWVEVMGFSREETIGRPLTDFFTPGSRKYALNIIFPRFFSTGFCKDIPYTYIKKDGIQMDVLLSCYGVRNQRGEVIRSLAVSVD